MKEQIVYRSVSSIHPYPGNPRRNDKAVEAVAESIRQFGFKSPILIDRDGMIVNGHTRFKAAKKLGYEEIPCLIADDLTEEQIKAYRLIDNKTSEYATWDANLLSQELEGITLDFGFDFDFSHDSRKAKSWDNVKQKCDLKLDVRCKKHAGSYVTAFYRKSREGQTLEEIKSPENVQMFVDNLVDYIEKTHGNMAGNGWCIVTTPRRRHVDGFHFATEICRKASGDLCIPFYEGCITAPSRHRIGIQFSLVEEPRERNIVLYDDIITTGSTMKAARDLLTDLGYTVLQIAAIDNN